MGHKWTPYEIEELKGGIRGIFTMMGAVWLFNTLAEWICDKVFEKKGE